MPAPIAKGLIITASIIVAAGIAIYENEQIRQWFDDGRRKVAHAFQNFGDNSSQTKNGREEEDQELKAREEFEAAEERRRWRDELMRRNRAEMIRKAREEGVSVDLDELARLGREVDEKVGRKTRVDRSKSFDEIVGTDGMLKSRSIIDEKEGLKSETTALDSNNNDSNNEVRHRNSKAAKSQSEGLKTGTKFANPFDDEAGGVLFDISSEKDEPKEPVKQTEKTYEAVEAADGASTMVIQSEHPDLYSSQPTIFSSSSNAASSPAVEMSQQSLLDQSFHSFPSSSPAAPSSPSLVSAGTLTPTEEEAPPLTLGTSATHSVDEEAVFLSSASNAGTDNSDIAVLSPPTLPATSPTHRIPMSAQLLHPPPQQHHLHNHSHNASISDLEDIDARSEAFSESEFSFVSDGGPGGRSTPGSWTDVGSDDGNEMLEAVNNHNNNNAH